MANFGELDKLTVHNNILDRLTALERAFRRFQRVDVRVDEISEFGDELGEMVSGADVEGEELANPAWSASTNLPGLTVYTTDRMPANEFALMEFRVNMTPPYRVFKPNENGIYSYLKIAWYDAMSGGSEIARDDLAFWSVRTFRRTLLAPAGAVACAFVCGLASSNVYGLAINSVSGFSAREMSWARRLSMDPLPSVQVEGLWERLASGKRDFPSPAGRSPSAAQVTTGTGNLANGAYRYKVTWVDEFGETTPSMASTAVSVDATHKQVTVSPPLPIPAGITAWRIYRTLVDGAETDPFYLVATVNRGTTTYQDNIADANLGKIEPDENTTLGRPVLPTAARQMGNSMRWKSALDWNAASSQIHGEYWRTPDAIGEWCAPDPVILEAGRYQMTLLGVRSVSGGPVSVFMDGKLIGQINQYNSTTSYNHQPTLDFVIEEPGSHEFVFVTDGSAASRFYLTEYWVRRVGR